MTAAAIHARDSRPTTRRDAEVLVVGAGAAGVAAAVTAARQGLDVLMVERYGFCGGGAVAGLSGTVCGLYESTSDPAAPPRQLVYGFADEFVRALDARGGATAPVRYGRTWTRVHDPLVWREAADALVRAAGVRMLFHATVTEVLVDGGERVEGVVANAKQGRIEIRAKLVVDASGDADVAAMAGFGTFVGLDGRVQNPTMIFRLQGVDIARFLAAHGDDSILPERIGRQIAESNRSGAYRLPRTKVFLFPTPRPGELLCNATRVLGADGRELDPLDSDDITEAEIEGRRQAREYARFFRDHLPGCEASWINDTGVQAGTRQTRQLAAVQTLTNDDVVGAVKRRDGVARSPWPIELHSGEKPRLVWLERDFYEVPYDAFVPVRGAGLVVAGRCLAAEHEAMASARVTAQCFSYGHAIGHAAAIAVRERVEPRAIPGAGLRERLNRDGAALDA